jgi:LacI family transcriptional regulator
MTSIFRFLKIFKYLLANRLKMKNQIIRIKDIAEKANVSVGTVDRVLHNRGRVAEPVRLRILQILEECNYQPNLMARALVSNKRTQLAVLMPNPSMDIYWQSPRDGVDSALKDLKQYGITIEEFLFNPEDANSFMEQAKALTALKPDGILLSPIFYRESIQYFKIWNALEIPFILFNTEISECNPLSYIGQDSYQSGMLAGKLIHYGEKYPCRILIAHIDEEINNAAHLGKKEQGLRDYFSQTEQLNKYEILSVELKLSELEQAHNVLEQHLFATPRPAQIFVTTSRAHHIAKYLQAKNVDDVKVIGYDLLPQNIAWMRHGTIAFLINQNPKGQGYWGIYELVNYLVFKKDVNKLKFLPLDIVTLENLGYYVGDSNESFKSILI